MNFKQGLILWKVQRERAGAETKAEGWNLINFWRFNLLESKPSREGATRPSMCHPDDSVVQCTHCTVPFGAHQGQYCPWFVHFVHLVFENLYRNQTIHVCTVERMNACTWGLIGWINLVTILLGGALGLSLSTVSGYSNVFLCRI